MLTKIFYKILNRKFVYNEVCKIIYKRNDFKTRIIHITEIFCYFQYVIRYLIVLHQIAMNENYEPSHYEFFHHFFRYISNDKDVLFILTFIMLFIYCILMEYCIYFTPANTVTWLMYEDWIIKTMDAYHQSEKLNESFGNTLRTAILFKRKMKLKCPYLPDKMINLICQVVIKAKIWLKFEHINKSKLEQLKMKYFPFVPLSIKIKIIQTILIADKITNLAMIAICNY